MIISKGVDVEIFVNMFSVTFVSLTDYLDKFKDCVDDKGNPLPLTDCLSVKEIKERLDTVQSDIFYISDTDDSQLLELVSYINSMSPHYDTIEKDDVITQTAVRTDLFGFNNLGYDDYMIKAFLMKFNHFDSTKALIQYLKRLSDKIINLQKDRDAFYHDKEIELINLYKAPYTTVDVQKIYALDSVGVNIDKEGNRLKFGKGLKQTSINLKWHELLDFTLPPINQEEYDLYWSKLDNYRGKTLEQLNNSITNDFERYVLPKYIKPMLYYNKNDVFLVCEIVRQKPDEVKLRYSITKAFNVNVLCSSRANIADKLTIKFYSDRSGLRRDQFINERTERTRLSFNKIIFPHIKFKTKKLQDFLEDIKKVYIYHTNGEFKREIEFYGTTYTIATGGIHSQDEPVIFKSDDKFIYRHHD